MADRAFSYFLRRIEPVLAEQHRAELAASILARTRQEYVQLRPQVPDIGGRANVFQPVMAVNGWIVALHRAMTAHGLAARDTVSVCHAAADRWFRGLPPWALRAIGRILLSAPCRWYLEAQARRSQKRRYSQDFVWRVERGEDGEVSLVFDECAVNKWYVEQDVRDLAPYCNFFDVTYSRLMGMGLDAHETIGLGCARCVLRYKRGRETAVPPTLRDVVEEG